MNKWTQQGATLGCLLLLQATLVGCGTDEPNDPVTPTAQVSTPTPTNLDGTLTPTPQTATPTATADNPTPTPVSGTPTPTEIPGTPTPTDIPATPTPLLDVDQDGYNPAEGDCDEGNANINPDAVEVCDGVDNDCDQLIDDQDDDIQGQTTWYPDFDMDLYGDETKPAQIKCEQPDSYAAMPGDCNDADAAYNPGATEDNCADPNDYNCDGATGYEDADGDGYPACEDCNDGDADINPDATEICDGVDNNCDSLADDDSDSGVIDASNWYQDSDMDGYGAASAMTLACVAPTGSVDNGDDCDDTNADISPDLVWFADSDGDGQGDANNTIQSCEVPDGYTTDSQDCDDSRSQSYVGADELCDGLDNDCDQTVDEDSESTFYADVDGDGFGRADFTQDACEQPNNYVTNGDDCNDEDNAIHPDATEVCDGIDNNCDAALDEGFDLDGDGHTTCAGDCDDEDQDRYPTQNEACDDIDNDCDGSTDEGVLEDWYLDIDEDGYGQDETVEIACSAPTSLYASEGGDCDDANDSLNPGAEEVCDGIDNNCNDSLDEGFDLDDDGYTTCNDDCDDNDPDIYPGVSGLCPSGKTCLDILEKGNSNGDGQYIIDPDGSAGDNEPFTVECDMTRDGGGWTMGLKAWYNAGIMGKATAEGIVDDALSHKGNAYKLSDDQIRAVIGIEEHFDVLADQSGYNSSYSTGNYEHVILRNYTARWRFDGLVSESSTQTVMNSYESATGLLAWEGRLGCGTAGGAHSSGRGINCLNVQESNPAGGSGCDINMGLSSSSGWHHFYMSEHNSDTYLYICNGPQHSSGQNMNHRFWFRKSTFED